MNTVSLWQKISPIQSTLYAIAGGIWSAIQQHGFPTSIPGWLSIIGPAMIAVAGLHTTAPRHQDQTK
jgi:hypothetical protein